MSMRWMWLVTVAACNFERGDGAAGVDAPGAGPGVDAAPVPRCRVHASGSLDDRGEVGGDGGGDRPDLICPEGELPIGAEFEVNTQGLELFNFQPVVVHVHFRCGRVERTFDNKMITTPSSRVSRLGGTCAGPLVSSGEQRCPAGAVLVGIRGNESGGDASSINSMRLECAELMTDGTVTAVTTTLDFRASTGSFTNDLESSICSGGEAIVAFGGKAGCTQDQIFAKCAALQCD
jgi:hypothetical protein